MCVMSMRTTAGRMYRPFSWTITCYHEVNFFILLIHVVSLLIVVRQLATPFKRAPISKPHLSYIITADQCSTSIRTQVTDNHAATNLDS